MSNVDAETGTAADAEATQTVASAVAAAPFVRLFGHADGDSVAACGLLAVALREQGIPFRVHVAADPTAAAAAAESDDAGDSTTATDSDGAATDARTLVVSRGRRATVDLAVPTPGDTPASVAAAAISRDLGVDPDPVLALAGVIAAGATPGAADSERLLEAAQTADLVARRPGVALPTADIADGLAHTTRFDASFSGDPEAAADHLAEIDVSSESDGDRDDAAHTRLASLVAVETATAPTAAPQAADSVEAALRPYATPAGPCATLGGYADVLSALARERPGAALSLAFDAPGAVSEAIEVWRAHGAATHAALASPTVGRYDGVSVFRVETDRPTVLPTVARLARRFRSPEPVALVVTEEPVDGQRHAAAAAVEQRGLGAIMRTVAGEFDGDGGGTPTAATLAVDGEIDAGDTIAAVRETLDA
ncbi:MAG: hypothetical protein J07HN6_00884 [Halonotius sp. J07HN6]|nr:MAG: hypothetical protein J07HN6_00884 [Halonotius sp. J07HN6]